MEEALKEIYAGPNQPGSFGGADKVQRALKKVKNIKVSTGVVQKWLKQKDTYTKFRAARKNFKRNPIIAPHIDAQWQGDLAEVGNIASHTTGVRYLLVVIDVVSKYTWVEPLLTKNGPTVLLAFQKILKETMRLPKKMQTDDGKEFLYGGLQKYFERLGITFFTVKSDKKAAIAERVIKTLKEKIYRYMHEKHTHTYIDVLQDLVSSYNNTYHSSIKMAPSEVAENNEGEVLRNLYGKAWEQDKKKKRPKFREGDFVRISRVKGVFEKGYVGQWTEEIFIVDTIKLSAVPNIMYKLKDWSGEPIEGSFYDKELQLVSKGLEDYWKVETILRTKFVRKNKKKVKMYYVKWEGYQSSVNSWVTEADIKRLADDAT